MKKISAFALMSSALLLGACSNETPDIENNELEGGLGYIRIDFEDLATRAGSDANATADESEIQSADFIFYDASGAAIHTSHITGTPSSNGRWLTNEEGNTHGGNKCAIVKLPKMASSVGCVLNSATPVTTNPDYMSNYAQDMVNNKLFYMSSSRYYDAAGHRVFASPIDAATQLFRDEADAVKATGDNAVKVYVERYVARVDVKYDLGNTINAGVINPESEGDFINGSIEFVPEFSYLTAECQKSTRVKRLPSPVWDWMKNWTYNDLANHRSYIVDYTTVPDGSNMKYTTLNKMKEAGANFSNPKPMYVNENCEKDTVRMTSLVVAGKYTVKKADGTVVAADGTGSDAAGTFYLVAFDKNFDAYATEAEAIQAMGGNPATDKLVPEGVGEGANSVITLPVYTDQVKWEGWNGWMKLVDKTTGKDKEIVTRCVKYSGGYGYYAKKIKRATIGTTTYNAIVRNHVYELTVKGIAGMGVGIPDPDQPIIPIDGPDPASENYYLHMNVNINPWTLVKNDVIWK